MDLSRNILDNSDDDLVEPAAKNQNASKVLLVEQYIRGLGDPTPDLRFCRICDSDLKSHYHAKTHYNASKHIQKIKLLKEKLLTIPIENWPEYCSIPASPASLQFRCEVCDVDLVGRWRWDCHQNDPSHIRNTKGQSGLGADKDTITESTNLCPEENETTLQGHNSSKISNMQTDNDSSDLQPNYCNICLVTYDADQFEDHKRNFIHVAIETLKTQYRPEIVDTFCSITCGNRIHCLLCGTFLQNLLDVKSHMNSTKHLKRFQNVFGDCPVKEKRTNSDIFETEVKTVVSENTKDEISAKNSTLKEVGKNSPEKEFYCYVCKMEFDSLDNLKAHTTGGVHVKLAGFKSEIVSLGVPYAEYWTQSDDTYCCTLCNNAQLFGSNTSKLTKHVKGIVHKERLMQWCFEFSTWKCGSVVDPKYFYCKICDVPLVGTSEAEQHYKKLFHLSKAGLFCQTCNVTTSTKKTFKQHKESPQHQEKLRKGAEAAPTIFSDNCSEIIEGEDHSLLQEFPNISVKHKVFKEIEKMVNTLYYSKSIPYHLSLEFLKHVNKDIIELVKKYQGSLEILEEKDASTSSECGNSSIRSDNEAVIKRTEESSVSDNNKTGDCDINSPSCQVDAMASKQVEGSNSTVNDEGDIDVNMQHLQPENNIQQEIVESLPTKPVLPIEECYNSGDSENGLTGNSLKNPIKPMMSLDELLDAITFRKSLISQFNDVDNVDISLMTEIETLIKLVQTVDLPPVVILDYLQTCNQELDKSVSEYSKTGEF